MQPINNIVRHLADTPATHGIQRHSRDEAGLKTETERLKRLGCGGSRSSRSRHGAGRQCFSKEPAVAVGSCLRESPLGFPPLEPLLSGIEEPLEKRTVLSM